MVRYIGKRLLQIIPIFFVVSVLIFALVRMSPTEPITVILGGKQSTQAAVQAAQEKFHLNEPIVKQYFRWMIGMFHGDFGQSYKFQQSVGSMITERIPVTLGLVGFSSVSYTHLSQRLCCQKIIWLTGFQVRFVQICQMLRECCSWMWKTDAGQKKCLIFVDLSRNSFRSSMKAMR